MRYHSWDYEQIKKIKLKINALIQIFNLQLIIRTLKIRILSIK